MTRRNGDRNPLAPRAVNDDGERYDGMIVCSDIAGVLAAVPLVRAGLRVFMLERGDRVPQDPRNAEQDRTIELTSYHAPDRSYLVRDDARLWFSSALGRAIAVSNRMLIVLTAGSFGFIPLSGGGRALRRPARAVQRAPSATERPFGRSDTARHHAAAKAVPARTQP